MKVAIVGAGIVGLSAARFLCARGHQVTLFERFPLFHTRGSSHGRTRIVRRAYPDPFYTGCMLEAYPLWADLEQASGTSLIDEVGLAYIADRNSERLRTMLAGLQDCEVPHEVRTTWDGPLKVASNELVVFTPQAGFVRADLALRATHALAVSDGLRVEERAADMTMLQRDFDAFVVAAGAWVRDFAPVPVSVTMETFGYAQIQVEGPVWIDDTDSAYGFPSDDWGMKLGEHHKGYPIDPGTEERTPDPDLVARMRAKVKQRFGVDVEVHHATGCLYTSTSTEDFVLGRLGEGGFFASACSGHGFKTGPWVGRLLADFVEGTRRPEDLPRFFLAGS